MVFLGSTLELVLCMELSQLFCPSHSVHVLLGRWKSAKLVEGQQSSPVSPFWHWNLVPADGELMWAQSNGEATLAGVH